MEHGFYHPDIGYWQTNSNISETMKLSYPSGTMEVPLKPGENFIWSGSAWVAISSPEEIEIPKVVSRFQAKAALYNAGLLSIVEDFMDSASPLAKLAWMEAQEFQRNSPTIIELGSALGLTNEQIDNLFVAASQILA